MVSAMAEDAIPRARFGCMGPHGLRLRARLCKFYIAMLYY